MSELVDFSRARLAEDETTALEVIGDIGEGDGPAILGPDGEMLVGTRVIRPAATAHIARHSPLRVLADVAAKRSILAWLDAVDRIYELDDLANMPDTDDVREALADPYVDHPDYRAKEWGLST